jgi:hypothetical protein
MLIYWYNIDLFHFWLFSFFLPLLFGFLFFFLIGKNQHNHIQPNLLI